MSLSTLMDANDFLILINVKKNHFELFKQLFKKHKNHHEQKIFFLNFLFKKSKLGTLKFFCFFT